MMNPRQDRWIRAAVAASVWSASEVVLGFLLHSYRIPFKGQILTGIAILILTALHKEWGGRGIVIRAALICALLKFLAPTPKIIGPVVAILAEGALIETAILLLGARPLAYLLGGGLAMLWTFIQKIAKLLFYYGQGMVELYSEILKTANLWLSIQVAPLALLGLCATGYFLLGGLCGLIGMKLGVTPIEPVPQHGKARASGAENQAGEPFAFSPARIFVHLFFVGAALFCAGLNVPVCASMLLYLAACFFLYRKRLGKVRNIRIWIPVFTVMALSGMFLHRGDGWFSSAGLYTGLAMGLRACFITFGVHFLMLECAHPKIKAWLIGTGEGQLVAAVDTARECFRALEGSLNGRRFFRHPVDSVKYLIGVGLGLERNMTRPGKNRVLIMTGGVNSGKSRLLQQYLQQAADRNESVAGVVAEAVWKDGVKHGYDALFLPSGQRCRLCRKGEDSEVKVGRFGFNSAVFGLGSELLAEGPEPTLTFVDEVGPLELAGQGWASLVTELLARRNKLLLIVRRDLIAAVAGGFNLNEYTVIDVEAEGSFEKLVRSIHG